MKKIKVILAGLTVAVALMFGVVFTGASVSSSSTVAEDIQKPGHGAVALVPASDDLLTISRPLG
jgi:hypothetical protein